MVRPSVVGNEIVFHVAGGVTLKQRLAEVGGYRRGTECRVPLNRLLDFEDLFGHGMRERDESYDAARFGAIYGVGVEEQQARAELLNQDAPCDVKGLKVPLYPFQARAVRFLHRAGSGILGDEPGLGKTLQALAWSLLHGGQALVICPAGAVGVWEGEVASKTHLSVAVLRAYSNNIGSLQ